jgi:hypothetical protein
VDKPLFFVDKLWKTLWKIKFGIKFDRKIFPQNLSTPLWITKNFSTFLKNFVDNSTQKIHHSYINFPQKKNIFPQKLTTYPHIIHIFQALIHS